MAAERNETIYAAIEDRHPDLLFLRADGLLVERVRSELREPSAKRFDYLTDNSIRLKTQKGIGSVPIRQVSHAFASASDTANGLRPVRGIAEHPYFYGSPMALVETPGYHPGSQLWLPRDRATGPPHCLCSSPCGRLPCRAVGDRLLSSRFADPASRLHAAMAFLSPFLFPGVAAPGPGYMITAETSGAGKSFLAELICTVARDGRLGVVAPSQGRASNELGWKLAAVVQRGDDVLIDNLPRGSIFQHDELAAWLTGDYRKETRAVGSASVSVDFRGRLVFLTGIAIVLQFELDRRCLDIRLLPLPSGAKASCPKAWVRANRRQVQANLIAAIQRWIDAGAPPPPTPHPSFVRWSSIVAGAACFIWPELAGAWAPDMDQRPPDAADLEILIDLWPRGEDGTAIFLPGGAVVCLAQENRLAALLTLWTTAKGPNPSRASSWLRDRSQFESQRDKHLRARVHRPAEKLNG